MSNSMRSSSRICIRIIPRASPIFFNCDGTLTPTGPKIDVVCSSDVASPLGFTMSCKKFALHIADAFIQAGEIAQRLSEVKQRLAAPGGPADLTNVITFEPKNEPQVVWLSGDVKVSAIRSTHIVGPCLLSGGHPRWQRGDRGRRGKRYICAAAHVFDIRSSGKVGEGG